jgi:CBS-domain-containing membrane protein
MGRARVRDVMTSEVVSVGEGVTYRQVVALLSGYRISAVPVVDERRRVLGVVSEADLTHQMIQDAGPQAPHRGCQPHAVSWSQDGTVAADLMTSPAVTIEAEASLAAAARLMEQRAVKRLPVVDRDGVLIGIVSRRDLLRVHQRCDEEIRRAVEKQVLWEWFQVTEPYVRASVRDGVVTLIGELPRRRQTALAAHLTRSVDGVVEVVNRLTYRTDDAPFAPTRPVTSRQ